MSRGATRLFGPRDQPTTVMTDAVLPIRQSSLVSNAAHCSLVAPALVASCSARLHRFEAQHRSAIAWPR